MSQLLERLNPDQRNTVTHTEGNVLVLAGAGSGKTACLTSRIAYIIEQGVPGWQILAVTFTNKASKEMRSRVVDIAGPEARDVWMGTFHSICIRMLIRFGSEIGLDTFTLIDDADQKKIIKEVIEEIGTDFEIGTVQNTISNAKNDLLTPEELLAQSTRSHEEALSHIYMAYEEKKQASGYIDYDDCIMMTVKLFDVSKNARDTYQNQFRYVMTDEVQDTNHAQFQLLRRFSAHHGNLFAVGDVDQGIYSFRGAKLSNIINFQKYFPDTTMYKIEQNYRSTKTIVNASNALIQNNSERFDKTSFGLKQDGWPIVIKRNDNDASEAEFVSDIIRAMKRKGRKYEDVAVLYRTNRQSRMIETKFNKQGIPYQIIGGNAFNDRKEIKDIVGYMRAVANDMDELAFNRIINVPKRGIGDTTVGRIKDYASECDIPFSKALENIDDVPKISKRAKTSIQEFSKMIDKFKRFSESEGASVAELINKIYKESGYKDSLDPEIEEDASRRGNIEELINLGASWDEDAEEDATLSQFLTETSLSSDLDSMEDDAGVTLMTIHSSKGLEFPFVFIIGAEQGIFPHGRALGSQSELEEERRLFYVAMTRAEERLFISHCQYRYQYGSQKPMSSKPSVFLSELPNQFIKKV